MAESYSPAPIKRIAQIITHRREDAKQGASAIGRAKRIYDEEIAPLVVQRNALQDENVKLRAQLADVNAALEASEALR